MGTSTSRGSHEMARNRFYQNPNYMRSIHQMTMNRAELDLATRNTPYVFRWNWGGENVALAGEFNGWKESNYMHKSGNEFTLIVDLDPSQIHQYKFLVDSRWKCSPNEPQLESTSHTINNFVDFRNFVPFDPYKSDTPPDDESDNLFGQIIPEDMMLSSEPQQLPPMLKTAPFNKGSDNKFLKDAPNIGFLNHYYVSWRGEFKCDVKCFISGFILRYRNKYTSTFFYSHPTA